GGIANRGERRCLAGAGGAFECHDLIAVRQNLLNGLALTVVQVAVVVRDGVACALAYELRVLALTGTHLIDRFSLEVHHRWRCERPPGPGSILFDGDELASFYTTIEVLFDVADTSLAERPLQSITQDRAFFDDGFTLQIAIARERDGAMRDVWSLRIVLQFPHAAVFDRFNNPCRLGPVLLRQLSVALLHLAMRDLQLGFARLVRRDLRRGGPLAIRFGEVAFDLLPARAGRLEVLARVTVDLRLAAPAALDLVA